MGIIRRLIKEAVAAATDTGPSAQPPAQPSAQPAAPGQDGAVKECVGGCVASVGREACSQMHACTHPGCLPPTPFAPTWACLQRRRLQGQRLPGAARGGHGAQGGGRPQASAAPAQGLRGQRLWRYLPALPQLLRCVGGLGLGRQALGPATNRRAHAVANPRCLALAAACCRSHVPLCRPAPHGEPGDHPGPGLFADHRRGGWRRSYRAGACAWGVQQPALLRCAVHSSRATPARLPIPGAVHPARPVCERQLHGQRGRDEVCWGLF